ncbi:hypothetical protein [Paracoccus sp. KR1-242]|uniref:hypothetical protein n=1 Tax=Paracoccus sp. KR1-242 TaxID=3410028 RepID=UPI003C0F03D9
MSNVAKFDPQTGEVMSTDLASFEADNVPLAVKLAKVELDQAISTAKAYPRSLTRVRDNVSALVMLDEETAKECVYALPRGGKPIKGPSVRFAEIVASQYGNCKVGSRVVDVDRFEKFVEAEGVFIDLETGMQRTARIRRKISDKTGRIYNDDMIVVTGNAACAIALREAILKGVPKALWRRAYDEAEGVIAGDIKTLAERRDGAIKAFATWGVTPDQIYASLEIEGMDEIGLDEIGTLMAMFKGIKAGEQQVEDFFPAKAKAADAVEAAKGTSGKLAQIADGAKAKDKEAQKEADHKAAEANREDDRVRQEMQDKRDAKKNADTKPTDDATAETGATEADQKSDQQDEGGVEDKTTSEEAEGQGDADSAEVEKARSRGIRAGGRGQREDSMPPDVKRHPQMREAWLAGLAEGSKPGD